MEERLISRNQLASRWGVTAKTIDRLRKAGKIPWLDLTHGRGRKTLVRFKEDDILAYERLIRLAPFEVREARENDVG